MNLKFLSPSSFFFAILSCFLLGQPLYSQRINYTVVDSMNFKIEQKKTYTHPNYNPKIKYDLIDLGPCLSETYIDDPDIKTISDLNKFYSKGQIWMPKQWPDEIIVEGFSFKLALFENGIKMPVIVTSNGTIFSFLLEEGILAFDIKSKAYEGSNLPVKYDTVEIEKIK